MFCILELSPGPEDHLRGQSHDSDVGRMAGTEGTVDTAEVALGCSLRTELTEPVGTGQAEGASVLVGPGLWPSTKATAVLHWEGKREGTASFKQGTRPGCLRGLN